FELKKGMTAKIATGGMLPEGADAVVMIEHAQGPVRDCSAARPHNPAPLGENLQESDRGQKRPPSEVAAGTGGEDRPEA
ncbi:MAG: molybdopterin molybdenumtransferase MoeA, partial [Candidatus Altiarchaeota archaeon]|nr:molybdopterin molybdenumtransferase MoeA [Candidatus Altiarchaeota archaeon]